MSAATPSVLIVALARGFGGVNVRVVQTARALQDRGWPYRVLVLEGSPLHEALRQEDLDCAPVSVGRGDPRVLLRLRAAAREIGADMLDAHNVQSQVWAAAYGLVFGSVSKIASVHTVYRLANESALKGRLHEAALRACRLTGFRFLAVSRSIYDYLRELGVSDDVITLSRNGISPPNISASTEDIRQSFAWPRDAFVMCFAGRLEYQKNLGLLVDAFAMMKARGDRRVRLLIVGEGSKRRELEAAVARHRLGGDVAFAGYRNDVPSLLAQADLLCLTSHTEGLPYVLLEAAQLGVPVVSAETDGASELFVHQRDILFFPPGDAARLAELALAGIENPDHLREIGRSMQQKVMQELSIARMISQTLQLYAASR